MARTGAQTSGDRPHILYVLDRFPVLSETFVSAEAAEVRAQGASVSVVTARSPWLVWKSHADLDDPGEVPRTSIVKAHWLWLSGAPLRYVAYLRVLMRLPVKDLPFALAAPRAALFGRSQGCDWVHTHFAFRAASFGLAVSTLLGVPRSVTTHANDIFVGRPRILRARLQRAEVLTVSSYNREHLKLAGVASTVNHCGVDTEALSFAPHLGVRKIDLLFAGRLVPKKRPVEFVRAVAAAADLVPGLTATMIGDGPLAEQCRRVAAELGVSIEFTGAQSREGVLAAMSDSRLLCLPCGIASDGDRDGIPVVLMEAMALGTPVLSTSVSGIPELIPPGCGWLARSGSNDEGVDALTQAILRYLAADADEVEAVRVKARSQVERNFTLAHQAEGLLRARLARADDD